MPKSRRNSVAFNLLEVIVATFVFIAIVTGLFTVFGAHTKGISKARMTLVANELSEQIMEECVAARYQNIDQFHDENPQNKPPLEIDFVVRDREIKAKFYTIVTVTEIVPGTIKQVKVQVQWSDGTDVKNGRSEVVLVTELHSSA